MDKEEPVAVDIRQMTVKVRYGQIYLADEQLDGDVSGDSEDSPTASAGVIRVTPGLATLSIGVDWGEVPITVAVAGRDPRAELEGYEDVVEITFESPSGRIVLLEWDWDEPKTYGLPPLPAGPGPYRMRFHITGLDDHAGALDHYLQIWPEPSREPAVLKTTSRNFRYFLNPEAFNPDDYASGGV
ncbi:hypothetical protein [Streptosporangium amethystogenes]|uniref:hypothetical protein n=1 Tax=Streptosporangium amethystogenes TaxID=2002 RepID=UPI0012F982A0|nr:hypothetical protein [Streptosporangium amethystogenes]